MQRAATDLVGALTGLDSSGPQSMSVVWAVKALANSALRGEGEWRLGNGPGDRFSHERAEPRTGAARRCRREKQMCNKELYLLGSISYQSSSNAERGVNATAVTSGVNVSS